MKVRLGRGAMVAGACVAVSLFFLLCLVFYGKADYLSPERFLGRGDAVRFRIASALVEPFGAGAFLGLGLLFVWSVVAWFRGNVGGSILPRVVGVAAAIPSFCAMTSLAADPREFWAGSVGIWMGDVLYRGFGPVLGWTVVGSLFMVSLALATEFGFHAQFATLRGTLSFPLLPPEPAFGEEGGGAPTAVLEPPPVSAEDLAPPGPVPDEPGDVRLLDREEHLADVRRRLGAGEGVTDAERALVKDATDRNEMAAAIDAMFANAFASPAPAEAPPAIGPDPVAEPGAASCVASGAPAVPATAEPAAELFEMPEVPPFLADPTSGHPLLAQEWMVEGPTLPPADAAPASPGHARVIALEDIAAATKETEEFPVVRAPEVLPEFIPAPAPTVFSGVEFLPPSDELADPAAPEPPAPFAEPEAAPAPDPVPEAAGPIAEAAPAPVPLPSEVPPPDAVPADFEDEFFSFGFEAEEPAAEAPVPDALLPAPASGPAPASEPVPEEGPADADWLAVAAQDLGLVPVAEEEPAPALAPPVDEAHEALARLFGDPVVREEGDPGGPAQSEPREPPANLMPVLPEAAERVTLISDPVVGDGAAEHGIVVDMDQQVHLPPPTVVEEEAPAHAAGDAGEEAPSFDDDQAASAILDSLRDIFGDLAAETAAPENPPAPEKEPPALGAHGWGTLFPSMIEETESSSRTPTHAPPPEDASEIRSEAVAPVEAEPAPPAPPAPVAAADSESPDAEGCDAAEPPPLGHAQVISTEDIAAATERTAEDLPPVDAALVSRLVEDLRADAPAEAPAAEEAAPVPPVVIPESPPEPATPGESDDLYPQAVEAVRERGRGSVVVLQRKLGIGFTRATKVLAQLVESGILGPENASGAHPLL